MNKLTHHYSNRCRFHELALCCHEHKQEMLPELPEVSVLTEKGKSEGDEGEGSEGGAGAGLVLEGGNNEALLCMEIGNARGGFKFGSMNPVPKSNQPAQALIPYHYRLPVGIQDAVYAKPPMYGHLATNRFPPAGQVSRALRERAITNQSKNN